MSVTGSSPEAGPDAETAALLAAMAVDFADVPAEPTVDDRRAMLRRMALAYGPAPAPVAGIEDREIPGPAGPIPLRIYWPAEAAARPPLLLHIHGGGWAIGDPEGYERVCRAYCAAGGCVVVDVHYRRAPEHKYPAALEDCEAALAWAAAEAETLGADPARIAVTGDSAGGNLAAAVCQRTSVRLALQVLVYPVISASAHADFQSRAALGDGRFFLREADIRNAETEYLPTPAAGEEPGASPILAADAALARTPPALVVTAGLDPLRDEGRAYALRLATAGVAVEHLCVAGAIHGFVLFAGRIARGRDVIAEIGRRLRALA
ncbi:esterase/lipase (plasmid) [Phenylobacterium zucineum HLK1]|uniref:Esterase/lipase n=1 Tax=Phenylobacterium zucineum (strain HLK1) TaxID=450851 RepID=B4RID0_PHEZH|nr:alpha/beta hydrolase [Phenylobacterium zucineum]ACG80105.1 esterase/lipase [Phenylobacterium zucineum HLK1]